MKNILIIDDDIELCELLKNYFYREGFGFSSAHNGQDGLELLSKGQHHLVILDVMLPGKDGFEVLKEIRAHSDIPVIMLTAKGDPIDRIVGLEIGADDYISKPFNTRELSARVRAVLRRLDTPQENEKLSLEILRVNDLELSVKSRSVNVRDKKIALTNIEFRLLKILMSHVGALVSLDQLSAEVLGRRYNIFDRSISVHISNLRRKLGPYPCGSERIKTLRGDGFIYVYPELQASQSDGL